MMRTSQALGIGIILLCPSAMAQPTPEQLQTPQAQEAQALLAEVQSELGNRSGADVDVVTDRIRITLQEAVRASGGGVTVTNDGQSAIDAISQLLGPRADWGVEVQGHTSTGPLPSGFADRQSLSDAMAAAVAGALRERLGEGRRIESRGMAEWSPLESNSTWEGQQANERVEVYLLPPGYPEHHRPLFPLEVQTI